MSDYDPVMSESAERNARVIALMEESDNYCWAYPAGWGDDVPDRPRCNRPRGHDGNHVMHVVWAPDTDLSEQVLAFGGEAWLAARGGAS